MMRSRTSGPPSTCGRACATSPRRTPTSTRCGTSRPSASSSARAGAKSAYQMVRFSGTVITDVNPFVYSHPLSPDDIIDRDEETQQLLAAAVGGHYVRLYAP